MLKQKIMFGQKVGTEVQSITPQEYYELVLKNSGSQNVPATFEEWYNGGNGQQTNKQKWESPSHFSRLGHMFVKGDINDGYYPAPDLHKVLNAKNQNEWVFGDNVKNATLAGTFIKIANTDGIKFRWEGSTADGPKGGNIIASYPVKGEAIFGGSTVKSELSLNMPQSARESGIDALQNAQIFFGDKAAADKDYPNLGKHLFGYFAARGTVLPVLDIDGNVNDKVFRVTTRGICENNRGALTVDELETGGLSESVEDFFSKRTKKKALENIEGVVKRAEQEKKTAILTKYSSVQESKVKETVAKITSMSDDEFMSQFGAEVDKYMEEFAAVEAADA